MKQSVYEQYIKDLRYLVNIDSCQDSPEGLRRIIAFFEKEFSSMGWYTEKVDVGAVTPCLTAYNRPCEHYDFFITGHMDTVFPKGTAAERPFSIDGNVARGPGVCDMKHGLLSTLYAVRSIAPEVLEKRGVIVVFQPDEEIGSPHSRAYLQQIAQKSGVCLVTEAAENDDKPIHCIQRKGMIKFCFEFTGRAGHAGAMFTNGSVSAITEMAYWINSIMSLADRERETTANIGLVSGGTASNVVAQDAKMTGEVRFEHPDEADKARALIASLYEHAAASGVQVRRTLDRFEPPMKPTAQTEAFVARLREMASEEGREFEVRKRGGLSAANFISPFIPVCVDGMGPAGNGAHSDREYLNLDSIGPDTDFLARIISEC
ncbi:MAG: M20 family metallopeptidase [Spirochaetales bacterium]|nr:M20 family metallopeptidase [Spirochaetales bacterium]